MKKILIASLIALAASPAFADKELQTSATTSMQTPVSTTDCALLQEPVTINTSASNIGDVVCDATTANIGVSVANTSGKNKVFSAGSAGGGIQTLDLGTTVPTNTNTLSEATARAATTSGSS